MAKAAVKQFRQQMTTEQYDAIYAGAGLAYQQAVDHGTSRKFLERIRRKLGVCLDSESTAFSVNYTNDGSFVRLNYKTKCEKAPLDEVFLWKIEDNNARLMKYTANSPLLLTD